MAWAAGPVVMDSAVEASVHALPCTIKRTGPASVSSYFIVSDAGETTDGRPVLQSTFRGRALKGIAMDLPDGYSGVVLAREDAAVPGGRKVQRATSRFASFTAWNHDVNPTSTDLIPRAMQWLPVARELHRPVGRDDVQAALRELRERAGGEKRKREEAEAAAC